MRDGLFDQLLISLQQGPEPLANETDVFDWARAHAERGLPMDDPTCPWPIRRRHALMVLGALTPEVCERFDEAIAEREGTRFDREASRRISRERRDNTIQTFRLAGLITVAT